MIYGIGHDIVEMERVKKALEKPGFLTRYFTTNEIENLTHTQLAGNFCVKEAVAKALGTGFRGFSPADIEVLRDELGKPVVNLYNDAGKLAEQFKIANVFASISNLEKLVSAVVVLERI